MSRRLLSVLLALPVILTQPLAGQSAPWAGTAATSYPDRYRELWKLEPQPERSAAVKHLVLKRESGELVLEEGRLYLLKPIGGQVMGALFHGRGMFNFTAPIAIEQERLKLFKKTTSIAEPLSDLVLLFADSTLAEVERQLTFGPGDAPANLEDLLHEALRFLGDDDHQSFDPDVMRAVLNGEQTGLFYAHMVQGNSDPWMFMIDPHDLESVRFLARGKRTGFTHYAEPIAQFTRLTDTVRTGGRSERRPEAWIKQYTMLLRLPESGGGLGFEAGVRIAITADTTVGPWVPFVLFEKLQLDSARWESGEPATAYKGKDSPNLWVRLEKPLAKGEVRPLHLFYHGDLLDRALDLFFIKSSIAWYPVALDAKRKADFDITFESPQAYTIASVGDRTDSVAAPQHMVRTRWVTPAPIRNASFTLGVFDSHKVEADGVPPVTILWSDATHREITHSAGAPAGKNMKQQVGGDVSAALQFYQHVYGEAPVRHFYATEIPGLHGEAWPGIVGLSYVTFQQTDQQGFDEVFRAHEVGHQWWGIAVDFATYRDQWLSEGFSTFSGLWYLQTRRKDNGKYFDMLDRWKADIMLRREEPSPIWLGYRVATAWNSDAYNTIVYEKGAWVLHMLRILLLDMKTMSEDRFTGVMRDFYTSSRGRSAATADFQQAIERATGQNMDWFFRQWVYGSAIPTYKVAHYVEAKPDGTWLVRLRVDQERVPPEFLSYVPVTLELDNKQVAHLRVKVTGAHSDLTLPPMPVKVKAVRFNDMAGVLAEVKEVGW